MGCGPLALFGLVGSLGCHKTKLSFNKIKKQIKINFRISQKLKKIKGINISNFLSTYTPQYPHFVHFLIDLLLFCV